MEQWATATGAGLSSPHILRDFTDHLSVQEGHGPRSVRSAITGTRAYLDWLEAIGMDVARQEPVMSPRESMSSRLIPTDANVAEFLVAVESKPQPYAALLALLPYTGMKISEACRLRDSDGRVDESGWIVLRVRAPKHDRDVPVPPAGTVALARYLRDVRPGLLEQHRKGHRNHKNDWLFPSPSGKSTPAARTVATRLAREVHGSLGGAKLTCHAFRRYYVQLLVHRGLPDATIMQIVGHETKSTFRPYYFPSARGVTELQETHHGTD